jgi:putative phosphoesterase
MPSVSLHTVVGVISDTHGLLRPEVLSAFRDVTLILHAGDIGSPDVLLGLNSLAKTIAVRGNNDKGEWARDIPEMERARVGAIDIYMLHDLKEFDGVLDRRVRVVVSGHSHQPRIERRDKVLFLNPGSAGPRRFRLPVSVAKLTIHQSTVRAKLIELLPT